MKPMATTKSRKKKSREKNLELHYNQTRLNRVLKALGVSDLHKNLHADFREAILKRPDPPLFLDCPEGSVRDVLRRHVERLYKTSYDGISASDFFEVMLPLVHHIGSIVGCGVMAERAEVGFKKVTKEFFLKYDIPASKFKDYFSSKIIEIMCLTVLEETAPDRHYVKVEFGIAPLLRDRIRCKIIADVVKPQLTWVGGSWNYRLGTYYSKSFDQLSEVSWLSRCPLDYGLPGNSGESLPVYISGHALDRIRERVDDPSMRIIVMNALYFAMDNPVYHPLKNNRDDTLVELSVKNDEVKLGYLIVYRTRTEIIIKTFLFITMSNVPEGYKLHQRLRMTRTDYDFHELDKYSTLANSDITRHPKIRSILEECGFRGLLGFIDLGSKVLQQELQPRAEEMVRYFMLEGA
jgi:hypothetical protein